MLIHCRHALAGLPHLVGGLFEGLRRRVLRTSSARRRRCRPRSAGCGPALRGPPGRCADWWSAAASGAPRGPCWRARSPRRTPAAEYSHVAAVAVVVERRLAAHHQLDHAADAPHGAQQDVLGVPVHRGAAVGARPGVDVVPRPHHQRVAHDHPAGVGLPGGLQDQAARQVAAGRRHRSRRTGPSRKWPAPRSRIAPNTLGESGPRHAQPLHRTGRRDQAGVLAVGQERVVGDRRERVPQRAARRVRHGGRHGERRGRSRPPLAVFGVLQNHADIIDSRPARRPLVGACVRLCWRRASRGGRRAA